ncbi:MAG: LamG domain-containing protein [Planctomycetota bacterium]|jgi:hypothetical protein
MYRNLYYLFFVILLLGLVGNTPALTAPSPTAAEKNELATLDTDPNLVGWWKFDEDTGKTAADSSKHKRNGQLKGNLSFENDSVSGRIDKALKLDGDDDYIQITNYKGVTGTRARTVSAWVKTTSRRSEFVSWGLDDFGQMFIFGIIRGHGMGITPSGGYLYSSSKVHDDKWHHVVVVVEDVQLPNLHDDVRLYEDGEPAEIHDIGLLDLWPINTGSELDVRIGRGLKGLIDDVRIYDRPLSEDEVKALFKLQSNRPLPQRR